MIMINLNLFYLVSTLHSIIVTSCICIQNELFYNDNVYIGIQWQILQLKVKGSNPVWILPPNVQNFSWFVNIKMTASGFLLVLLWRIHCFPNIRSYIYIIINSQSLRNKHYNPVKLWTQTYMYYIENEANILKPTLTWKNCIYMYSMCLNWVIHFMES
jgi:hypothetical protein